MIRFTMNVLYDRDKDVYFINGSHSEIIEKKSLIDPFALWARVLEISSMQFKSLKECLNLLTSLDLGYIIRSWRPEDKMEAYIS
jgi:hypothetical protein